MFIQKIGLFCLVLLAINSHFSQASAASKQTDCTYFHESLPAVHFYRQFFAPSTCYIDVSPVDSMDLVYRSYLFSEQGLLMVFNSFGDGEPSKTTGARVFYFLPRAGIPERKVLDGNLVISLASEGVNLTINGQTGRLQSLVGSKGSAEIIEADKVLPTNQGGVEIRNFPGLILDAGFAMGMDPVSAPNRTSLVTGANGKSCRIKNSEIFTYSGSGEYRFTRDDQEFKTFLAVKCPELTPGY